MSAERQKQIFPNAVIVPLEDAARANLTNIPIVIDSGLTGLRGDKLKWTRRPRENTCRHRHLAQSRCGRSAEVSRGTEVLQRPRYGFTQHVTR